jgi:hypothetical protein
VIPTRTETAPPAPPPCRRPAAGGRGRACSRLIAHLGLDRSSNYVPRHRL